MKSSLAKIFSSRFTYMIIVGVIIFILVKITSPININNTAQKYSIFLSIALTVLIWEGNLFLDRQFAKKFPWTSKPFLRIVLQVSSNIIYTTSLIYLGMKSYDMLFCEVASDTQKKFLGISLIIGSLVSLLLLTVEFGTQFFKEWKASLIEVERYKQESIEAQLEVLKGQINPHFLFNNLSVLSSLVYIDQDKAVEFINQFAKVYRYVLECNSKELTELNDELEFIKSYIYLLEIRFGKNIQFDIDIDKKYHAAKMPPMALELLVENTIKHNEVSSSKPLQIHIHTHKANYLTVTNNLQLRTHTENGTKLGLQNIKKRYRHYTELTVSVKKSDTKFTVEIPLLT